MYVLAHLLDIRGIPKDVAVDGDSVYKLYVNENRMSESLNSKV